MKKKGISLITLVITIVVVIILAAAVVLALNKNNPISDSRVAQITQTRDSLSSGILIYATNVQAKTIGELGLKDILIDNESYRVAIDDANTNKTITKNEQEITLYILDKDLTKEKLNVDLKDNNDWYIDANGLVYLAYENSESIPTYMKNNSGILSSMSNFVTYNGGTLPVVIDNLGESGNENNNENPPVVKEAGSITLSSVKGALKYNENLNVTVTNPNNVSLSVASSDENIAEASVSENTVTITAKASAGNVTITVTGAEDETHNAVNEEYKISVWSGTGAMPIDVAKAVVNSSNISSYIGTQVAYSPTGGGTWRIFYLDTTGKYGDGANTLFIKRDYDDDLTVDETAYRGYTTGSNPTETFSNDRKTTITASMAKMNSLWATRDGVLNKRNEYFSSYLCDSNKWTAYKTDDANYAIGSPSIEMYMDAYNQWGGYASGRGPLSYGFTAGAYGYSVGMGNSNLRDYLSEDSLSSGPSGTNLFYTQNKCWWLASPGSNSGESGTSRVDGENARIRDGYNVPYGVCPIASLK